jgi:hypothetical protein
MPRRFPGRRCPEREVHGQIIINCSSKYHVLTERFADAIDTQFGAGAVALIREL